MLTIVGTFLMIAGVAAIPGGVLLGTAQPAAASTAAGGYTPITGAGSTWSANAINAWIANVHQFGIRVNYSATGSTAGRQAFALGTADFGASEIPYGVKDGTVTDPPPARGYAYMPDTAGGTTFMYYLKVGNTQVKNLRLSGKAIAGIFTGVITNWDDPLIQSENPAIKMPNLKIVPVVRSDGSGATAEFTQWMLATQPSYWKAYCAKIGFSPCTQTSAYPVLPNSSMQGKSGDLGVSAFVTESVGTIGYVEYSYAKAVSFPVALVLNQAGYYTEPTAQNVAVSLLKAKINSDKSSPLYLTQDLSAVYTDPDPRTYELSSYSYMILPTSLTTGMGFNATKGYTLGQFGQYLLCQGQTQVDGLGYSALPINLVEAGYAQLAKIPGAQIPASVDSQIAGCHNPTFSTNGTNTLATTDPNPPACDKAGPTQCATATGGAGAGGGSGGSGNGSGNGGSGGGSSNNGSGSGGTSGGSGTSGNNSSAGSSGSGAPVAGAGAIPSQSCDPTTGVCSSTGNGTLADSQGNQTVDGQPVAAESSLGNGVQVALMVLGGALLVGLGIIPPLLGQAGARRRQRRMDSYFGGDDQS